MLTTALEPLLQCPACRRAAPATAGGIARCGACGTTFPSVGGIPWLFPEPARALGEWRNRLAAYLAEFAAAAARADSDLASVSRPTTAARLARLSAAYRMQQELVTKLLAPLTTEVPALAEATQQAFATRLPMTQDLHSYYANVHRDWAWGEEENRRSCELVAEALGPSRQRVLVLGAGGCRLAYDLHTACSPALTVALDINPLLLLVAKQLLGGQTVRLFEFPIAPRGTADEAVMRELRAPAPVGSGLELVFGDAWRAPFKPQSFDAVITPWLVDIVDLDFDAITAHVNRLLVPGGRWVNFGSLAFPWRRPALRLGRDELSPALEEAGFETASMRDAVIPYMRSPASRHSRLEEVLVFAADKRRRGPRDAEARTPPAWLERHALPVPRVGPLALAADASRIQALTLALIDGQRSIDDLVRIISEQRLLPPDQARGAVCGLLERLIGGAERG